MDQNALNSICLRQLTLSAVHEGETVAVLSQGTARHRPRCAAHRSAL
jgi:2,5-dihydroxypyridine 5,6-dioxygenase